MMIDTIELHISYGIIKVQETESKLLPKLPISSIDKVILIGDFNTHAMNEERKKQSVRG